jgi:hypothetical protein
MMISYALLKIKLLVFVLTISLVVNMPFSPERTNETKGNANVR